MPARQYTARRLHLGCCACLLLLVSYRPLALDAPRLQQREPRRHRRAIAVKQNKKHKAI